jgi:hypothetical protein
MNILQLLHTNRITFDQVGASEILLKCPICVGHGQHALYGKLYFNTQKNVGECKRCGWVANAKALCEALSISSREILALPVLKLQAQKSHIQPPPSGCIEAWKHPSSRAYLLSRGIQKEKTQEYCIYFCADGYYSNRLIIPVFDRHGNYRSFVSRTIYQDTPKYKYPYQSCVHKLLYNIDQVQGSSVWLVEGVFDAIHCAALGAVATFGKQISQAQIQLLRVCGFREVYLCWDAESHIETPELWQRAVQKLSLHFVVKEVTLPSMTPTEYLITELREYGTGTPHRNCNTG